jgi:hypothetical protein
VQQQLELARVPERQPELRQVQQQGRLRVLPLERVPEQQGRGLLPHHWRAAWNSCSRQRKVRLKVQASLPDGFDLSALEVSSHTVEKM